jgi:hypothetical protein
MKLDIRIRHRLMDTLHHRLNTNLLRECIEEDVPGGGSDRLLPQVMLQGDENRIVL